MTPGADKQVTMNNQQVRPEIIWREQCFEEIDRTDWHQICCARIAVFVVEQNCPYQELDGMDLTAWHLSAWAESGELMAYLRVLPPGARFQSPSIGRVLTTACARGKGLGRPLMLRGIALCEKYFPGQSIELSAQEHLQDFYHSLGFTASGARYLEDGIPHVDMRRE